MGTRHDRTLANLFVEPTKANIEWNAIEAMLRHHGAVVQERAGSRVAVEIAGHRAVFHRPHPAKEASRPTVRDVRDFCLECGLRPRRS